MDRAKATLDWSFKGMRTLILESKFLKVSVLLDKGSDIFELIYKPLDIDLIWHSPIGYRSPVGHIHVGDPVYMIHEFYGGGWNDIFPNYGKPSTNIGFEFGEHGESALLPWTCIVEEENGAASAKLSVECVRYPIKAEKIISLNSTELTISEDLVNVSEQQVEVSWAQHIAYGEPFVSQDLEIQIPASKAKTSTFEVKNTRLASGREFDWPNAPGRDGKDLDLRKIPPRSIRVQEDFPITLLKSPEYELYNTNLDLGVKVSWNRETFPYLWYWLNWGMPDYPYFAKGRTLALEPTTSSTGGGLAEDVKAGCAKILGSNSKVHGEIKMSVFQRNEQ